MQTGLLHLHSTLRYVIIILFLISIFKSLGAGNKPFTNAHKKIGLFLMIFFDINVLIGLVQWFTGGTTGAWGLPAIQNNGMGVVMQDATMRFFAVEHLLGMLLALVLVHIGYKVSKKNISDAKKHSKTALFYILAFIITLASIPWPFRETLGRGWFSM